MKVEVGQIFKVITDNFYADAKQKLKKRDTLVHLKNGEYIEIRYPYAWNFRTEDNVYIASTEENLLENCELFGRVKPEIKSSNNANLEEIIRLRLFDKVGEY